MEGSWHYGLLRAARRFDPERGDFRSFAFQHVRGSVLDQARRNDPRAYRHGTRPGYDVLPLERPDGERAFEPCEGPRGEAAVETAELVDRVFAAVGDHLMIELFVRAVLRRENLREVAGRVGVSRDAAAHLVEQAKLLAAPVAYGN